MIVYTLKLMLTNGLTQHVELPAVSYGTSPTDAFVKYVDTIEVDLRDIQMWSVADVKNVEVQNE